MEREATPIRRIHVSEQGRFGVARIDAAEQGLEALGYVLPNRVIGAALWEGLRAVRGRRGWSHRRASTGSELDGDARVAALRAATAANASIARAAGRRGRRRALAGARAGRHRRRPLGLRPDRDHRHDHHATLPRPRRLRAIHAGRADRGAAAGRRALWRRLDATARGRRAAARAARRGVPRRVAAGLRLPPRPTARGRAYAIPTNWGWRARPATSASASRSSAMRRRRCTRSPGRDSTSACAMPASLAEVIADARAAGGT